MHKWRLFWLLTLQLFYTSTFAQGEANIWYFGVNAGLDFNYNPPIALTNSAMVAYEGTAVLSDSLGQLLFYTDGMTVWNRQHNMLLNGYDLLGGSSTTQSALIIPKPGSSSLYYIFTIEQAENITWRLSYSEVDMQLDGGLGGVTSNKNIVLFSPVGEKITAVKHANNQDIWIISHDKFTNRYLTFQLTNSGVNPNPTILNAGSVDNSSPFGVISPNTGYLKASPLGDKIACAYTDVNEVDILNFNNATGTLSYEYTINNIAYPYGVEFSQNGSILYVSGIIPSVIKQYNLSLDNPTTIMATAFTIPIEQNPWSWSYSIQLGIDGKIYCSRNLSNYLDCIQSPDNIGSSCDYLANAIYLNGKNTQLGLPNFAPYLLTPPLINAIGNCSGDTVSFSLENAAAFDSVQWDFGDLNSGDLNYSNSINPIHIYQSGGTYYVSLVTFNGNQIDTLERTVNLYQTPNVSFPSDTLFCYLSNLLLYAGVGDAYVWQDGTSNPSFNVYTPGIYYVTASNFCGLSSDTVNVNVSYGSFGVNLGEDLNICEGDQVSFDMLQQTNSTYLWQDGSTNSQFSITQSGEYYVSVSNVCGTISDTVLAVVNPLPSVSLGDDISVCVGTQVYLAPSNQGNGNYLWQDGSTEPFLFVSQTGTFSVQMSNSCGASSDTISITLLPLPEISLGSDTLFCEGETIQISPTGIFDDFVWQNGLINEPLIITESGTYIAYANAVCGTTYDTVIATKISTPIEINFADSLSFCQGTSLELDLTQANVEYLWQDGSENPIYTITQAGEYHVTLSNSCGTISDTTLVSVNPLPNVSLGPDVSSCYGQPIILSATGTADNYLWQDGSTNSQFSITQSGEYYVSVSNVCGTISDTVLAVVNPLPSVFLGDDISVCNDISVQLIANGIADNYLWSDGTTNSSITVTSPGIYSVTVTNSCGSKTDSIVVSTGAPTTGFININECEAVNINGITYSTSGQFTQLLQNASGCDSILTINAEILDFNAQIFQTDSMLYVNGNPTSIQWINCTTGQAIPGATQTSFTPQVSGSYGAVITIGECVDTSNCRQIIQSPTPEKPSSLCDKLIVSPNPVNEQIEFTLDKSTYDIRLFTSTGALIKSSKGNDQKQILNFQDLAPAMYVLQVDECRFKIVKQ